MRVRVRARVRVTVRVTVRLLACELCDAEELHGTDEQLGVLKVRRRHLGDAAACNLVFFHVDSKRQFHQNLELRARVETADVKGRIGFRVAKCRSLLQSIGVGEAAHLCVA